MPQTPLQKAKALSARLGSPGLAALWTAVRREGIPVSKAQLKEVVQSQGERQIFTAIQPSIGKSAAPEPYSLLQMDLIDFRNQVNPLSTKKQFKFALIVVDVFTRQLWAESIQTKEPEKVVEPLRRILDGLPKKPAVMSSDQGLEFTGAVAELLKTRSIARRLKDTLAKNELAVVDRAIQALKKTIAKMMATDKNDKKTWVDYLDAGVKALNQTPKNEVLHGEAPGSLLENPQATFMVLQDNARKFQHNVKVQRGRVEKLTEAGAFRAPKADAVRKFKRGYEATYSGVEKVDRIEGSDVVGRDGSRVNIKLVKAVPEDTSDARERPMGYDAAGERKRQILEPIAEELRSELESKAEQTMSMVAAAQHLRRALARSPGENYDQLLKKARVVRLADVVRLFPELLEFDDVAGQEGENRYVRAV